MAVQGRIERSGVAWIIYLARKIRWVGVGGWLVGWVGCVFCVVGSIREAGMSPRGS